MTAPTQVFPPWLTPVPITTQVNGAQTVETSIQFIPLGYFGPSIPLGSVFTFGGSTFPPTIVLGPPTSTPSSTSPSLTPTEASTTSSTTPTPILSSTSPTSSTSTTPSTSSSSAVPSQSQSSAALGQSRGLSTGTKIAIGLSIGVVAILLLALWFVTRRVRHRRAVRSIGHPQTSGWAITDAAPLLPEEYIVRHNAAGGLTDAQRYAGAVRYTNKVLEGSTSASPAPRTSAVSGGYPAADGVNSSTSQQTNASRSTMAPSALFFNSARSHVDDHPKELEETARQSSSLGAEISDGSGKYAQLPLGASPPLLPPRSHGNTPHFLPDEGAYIPTAIASTSRTKSRHHSTDSLPYPESPPSEVDESATLLTAQRVDAGRQVPVSTVGQQQRHSPDNTREAFTLGASLAGLTQLTGLNRLSWLRRTPNQSPVAHRHSSPPLNAIDEIHRTSSFNRLSFHPASRPHSAILYPGQGSRPHSDFNYFSLADNELGLRPPTPLFSVGHSSGSREGSGNGSASARSGPTVYHSATSRSHSLNPSALELPQRTGGLIDLDTASGPVDTTIRTVDVLDIPVPEPILPFQAASPPVNLLSRTPSPRGSPSPPFPPGLVAVPRWDAPVSPSPESRETDILDLAPPRSPDEWSSMKSRRSPESNSPVERALDTEHAVEVASGSTSLRPMSQEAFVESGQPYFLGSPVTAGFTLTPRVSLYAPSEHVSYHTGSHSSRPSEHTTLSHETQASQNDPLSDDENYHPPPGQRASLSAIGGHRVRRRPSAVADRVLPAPEERVSEEEKSRAGSRPGSIVSGQTASETVVSRSTSNPVVQAFDSVGKASGQEAASIVDVLQSSRQ